MVKSLQKSILDRRYIMHLIERDTHEAEMLGLHSASRGAWVRFHKTPTPIPRLKGSNICCRESSVGTRQPCHQGPRVIQRAPLSAECPCGDMMSS